MASPALVYLCAKLAHDPNAGVREIGQRCMREFDEFALMKYARLTGQDEACLARAAQSAREGDEVTRAEMLEEGAEMVRQARSPLPAREPAAPGARRTRARRVAG
jgi:hypothetical protein